MSSTVRIGDAITARGLVRSQEQRATPPNTPFPACSMAVSSRVRRKGRIVASTTGGACVRGVVEVSPIATALISPVSTRATTTRSPFPARLSRVYDTDHSALHRRARRRPTRSRRRATARRGRDRVRAREHNTDRRSRWPRVRPRRKRSGMSMPTGRGDAQKAFEAAAVKHAATYHLGTHHHTRWRCTPRRSSGKAAADHRPRHAGAQNVQKYRRRSSASRRRTCASSPYVGAPSAPGCGAVPRLSRTLAAKMLKRRCASSSRASDVQPRAPARAIQTISLAPTVPASWSDLNDATTVTSRFEHYMETVCDWGLMKLRVRERERRYTIAPVDTYTPGDMRARRATGMTRSRSRSRDGLRGEGRSARVPPLNYADKDAMTDKPFTSKACASVCRRRGTLRLERALAGAALDEGRRSWSAGASPPASGTRASRRRRARAPRRRRRPHRVERDRRHRHRTHT